MLCQLRKFPCQRASQFFNKFLKEFFNFWNFQLSTTFENFTNISAILDNLSCETKNSSFDICKKFIKEKLCQTKPFDLVFNGECGINWKRSWICFFFIYLTLYIMHMHIISIHYAHHNLAGKHTSCKFITKLMYCRGYNIGKHTRKKWKKT